MQINFQITDMAEEMCLAEVCNFHLTGFHFEVHYT